MDNLLLLIVVVLAAFAFGHQLIRRPLVVGPLLLLLALAGGAIWLTSRNEKQPRPAASMTPTPAPKANAENPYLKLLPNSLDEFVSANPGASFAIRAPTRMKRGQSASIAAELSVKEAVDQLVQRLKEGAANEVQVSGDRISVAKIMRARLSGYGFDIDPPGSQEQVVLADTPTVWNWQIRALLEGEQTLKLTFEAVINVDGSEKRRVIQVKDWTIGVTVGAWDKLKEIVSESSDVIKKLKELWIGLAFFGGIFAAWRAKKSNSKSE